ncbi:MAG: hypothetical protein LBC80_03875 [Treponema sp.]|jgi:hypothetical protein|nr:hypothetical protein [Treponema sp.]
MLRKITVIVSATAIINLALSQFLIQISRLSAVEKTGISLFAFIILSLVTLFAVSRMRESVSGRIFAVLMNFITASAAAWYLHQLYNDEIFFRNLFYTLNRHTLLHEQLPLNSRILASLPLALVVLSAAVYLFCGAAIMVVSFLNAKNRENKQ